MDVEQRARDAMNEVAGERGYSPRLWDDGNTRKNTAAMEAVCRLIEQHDAFLREVSDAIADYFGQATLAAPGFLMGPLAQYILPDPVDRLLIEARKLVAEREANGAGYAATVLSGADDNSQAVQNALTALRRGMELAAPAQS
jgi:hypothetical protein